MLISEVRGWHWAITWDNPVPADSSAILHVLGKLGRVTKLYTKTTVLLAPKSGVSWRQIRAAITNNLDPKKGNVAYANLRSGKAFQWGPKTGHHWRRVT
jgi:hypothetical protein